MRLNNQRGGKTMDNIIKLICIAGVIVIILLSMTIIDARRRSVDCSTYPEGSDAHGYCLTGKEF